MVSRYSFETIDFAPATPDGYVPRITRELVQSIEHVPYSNRDVLDLGGLGAQRIKCTVIVNEATAILLESLLGTTGTLKWLEVLYIATLVDFSNSKMNFDGTHFWYDATWIIS